LTPKAVWEALEDATFKYPDPAGWLPYRLFTAALLGKDTFTGHDLHQGVVPGASTANSYVSTADAKLNGTAPTSPSVVAATQAFDKVSPLQLDPTHVEFYLNTLTGGGLLTSALGAGVDRLVANSNKDQAQQIMQKFYDNVLRNKTIFTLGDKRNIPGERMQQDKTAAENAHAGNIENLIQLADKHRVSGSQQDFKAVMDFIKQQPEGDQKKELATLWQDWQRMFAYKEKIEPAHLSAWAMIKSTPTQIGKSTVFADWYSKQSKEDKAKIKAEIPYAVTNIQQAGNLRLEANLVDKAQR
jgi:hypothetical protein